MTYDLITEDLKKWKEDERLFRDWHLVKEGSLPEEEFLERYRQDPVNLEYALHPESMETQLREDRFISMGRNVSILKHPRYLPIFFHVHDFFEINYVLSGSYTQQLEDRSISLSAGDLCLLAPNVTHGILVEDDDSVVLNILIRYSTFLDIFINTVRDKTQISQFFLNNIYSQKKLRYMLFHTKEDPVIRNYILDMYLEQTYLDQYSDRIICSLMTIFFTQLMRRHGRSMEIPELQDPRNQLVHSIIQYILSHYGDVSVEQIAGHFHYSRQYCSRLIREVTGRTYRELLTAVRIQQGITLLGGTSLSVADISEKLGYENPETFIRAFKKHQGETPAQYRKRTQLL